MNDNAKKWVAALRSGKYPQGRSRLFGPDGYCCLGVACDLAAKAGIIPPAGGDSFGKFWAYLPPAVQEWLGLKEDNGTYGFTNLGYQNDSGRNFSEIASIIESEPEGLFS